ncbi:MAG: helicase-related protein, partial [Hydrogenobaculum sp.]
MAYFITNEPGKTLKQRFDELKDYAYEFKFLTAFFYFSGIQELYELFTYLRDKDKLKEGAIKILVGLNVDKGSYGIYEYAKSDSDKDIIREDFIKSIQNAFTSKDTDKKDIYEQIDFFTKLLEERKLEIRKTRQPVHSKLYLFKFDNELIKHLFITGSSNLTRAGFGGQYEFNVEIKDYGFEDAEKYFDELWESSLEIKPEDIIDAIQQKTFKRKITPFEAYVYLLKNYIDLHRVEEIEKDLKLFMETSGYKPYNFQLEAVSQAIAMLEAHGGVIIADVVGLGKTVIASMVAKALKKRGIVICPPHLAGDENGSYGWRKYIKDFGLTGWEVRSLGKLEDTLEFVRENDDIEVVIVDEAHRFRNEKTASYFYLSEICRGKKVILLSATPFNNKPSDIFSMLKLFTIPKKSTIVYGGDLSSKFSEYHQKFTKLSYIKRYHNSVIPQQRKQSLKYYKDLFNTKGFDIKKVDNEIKSIAQNIRSEIEPVVIRRNRLDLEYYGDHIDFPEVKDPKEVFYELDDKQLEFYDYVISSLEAFDKGGKFTGAIYFPDRYEKSYKIDYEELDDNTPNKESVYQKNLYNMMRRLIVKRFESSFDAFVSTVKNIRSASERTLSFVEKTGKYILDRKRLQDVLELLEEDEEQGFKKLIQYEEEIASQNNNSKNTKIYELKNLKDNGKAFLEDIKKDIELFDDFIQKAQKLNLVEKDPKVQKLKEIINEYIKEGRKVVIFTEYLDTAKAIKEKLKEFEDILLPAFGNLTADVVESIYENFDAQYKNQRDRYKILLATDKLSEGFSLNRAGVVINYDIPWNPVKVIQRVGRINRIGKKVYNEIYIVNFFPTERGADIVKSREVAQLKMFMIHNILGEDAKIFSEDEEPQPAGLYRKINTFSEEQEESFFSKVYKELQQIQKENPGVLKRLDNLPSRIKVAKKSIDDEILIFIKRGRDLFVNYKDLQDKTSKAVPFESVYEKIKCSKDTKGIELSEAFWKHYDEMVNQVKLELSSRNQNTKEKALNILSKILMLDNEELKSYKTFVEDLKTAIKDYDTLSEYAVSEISNWNLTNVETLIKDIEKLKEKIGEDFLSRTKKKLNKFEEDIIIAIENRRI